MRALFILAVLLPQDGYLPLRDGAHWTYLVEDVGAEASGPARAQLRRRWAGPSS